MGKFVKSIYEFLPLKNDPTPEEIEAAIKEELEKEGAEIRQLLNEAKQISAMLNAKK